MNPIQKWSLSYDSKKFYVDSPNTKLANYTFVK